ncbi:metallophosphoesterase [Hymenobacter sp. BT770]|uniref:metallophosphoesterase family protein n=1 Tax=Hymenobacter sp. BT770 TaxID=2886942 RepID=UPI001D1257C3|nr:metallophosphoesterase [Hymenobacter sp. BT770]MCC3152819.1 metallophosphoesterase [Hymenobacter sp. BT770]MDO3414894.1 metallophosphoesterase [Hymenobacter sp. BT770]
MPSLPFLRRCSRVAPLAALLGLAGCDMLEFSPNDHRVPEEFTNLTQKNLAKLQAKPLPAGDTLRFVFTGDSQQFYDEAEALVASVNQQPGISFLVVAGDISDFGLGREMRWVDEKLRRLYMPYVTVVGNHDLVGNGREAYQHIFGALDYSFVYGETKFTMVDTNGREYNFNGQVPNLGWLRPQLASLDGARRQVVISHVPPTNEDFDPALRAPYVQSLREARGLVFKMNGHNHSSSISQPFNDGVTYVNSDAFSERHYMVVTVWGDKQFRIKRVAF